MPNPIVVFLAGLATGAGGLYGLQKLRERQRALPAPANAGGFAYIIVDDVYVDREALSKMTRGMDATTTRNGDILFTGAVGSTWRQIVASELGNADRGDAFLPKRDLPFSAGPFYRLRNGDIATDEGRFGTSLGGHVRKLLTNAIREGAITFAGTFSAWPKKKPDGSWQELNINKSDPFQILPNARVTAGHVRVGDHVAPTFSWSSAGGDSKEAPGEVVVVDGPDAHGKVRIELADGRTYRLDQFAPIYRIR